MNQAINSNKLLPDSKDWIEKVSENFDEYITGWIVAYKRGELQKGDIIKVIEKVARHKNDSNLVEMIKQRMP